MLIVYVDVLLYVLYICVYVIIIKILIMLSNNVSYMWSAAQTIYKDCFFIHSLWSADAWAEHV